MPDNTRKSDLDSKIESIDSNKDGNKDSERRQSFVCGVLNLDVFETLSATALALKAAMEKISHLASTISPTPPFGLFGGQPPQQKNEVIYPSFLRTYYHNRIHMPEYFNKDFLICEEALWRFNKNIQPPDELLAPPEEKILPTIQTDSTKNPMLKHRRHSTNGLSKKLDETFSEKSGLKASFLNLASAVNTKISPNPQRKEVVRLPHVFETFQKERLPPTYAIGSGDTN